MSFQAHLDTIYSRTGLIPSDIRRLAVQKGFIEGGALKPVVKAAHIAAWFRQDFRLGRGPAMTVYAILKDMGR